MERSRWMARPRARIGAALAVMLAMACGRTGPNFGSLQPDTRGLKIANKLQLLELSNGMRVVLAPDPRTNLVSVDVRYAVGAAQDPQGRTGLAHLVEHLTFQAASGTQGGKIFDKLTALSFYFNAYTSADVTHYTSMALADRIDALLELEAQRLEQKCEQLDDAAFTRERDVVLEEDAERHTALTEVLGAISTEVWGRGHPYARPLASREVATATKAEACKFFDDYYVPARVTLVVTGNFVPEALQQRLGRRFGPINRTGAPPSPPVAPARLDGTTSEHRADIDHPTALIYLPAPPWGSDDEPLHDVFLDALRWRIGALDEKLPWVIDTSVGYSGAGYQRVTEIRLELSDEDRLQDAVDAALAAGREMFEDEDSDGNYDDHDDPDDLVIARQFSLIRGSEQTATVTQGDRFLGHGDWLADFMTYTSNYDFQLAHMRGVDALAVKDVVERAKHLLTRDQAHVALIEASGAPTVAAGAVVASSDKDYDLPSWRVAIDPAEAAKPATLPRGAKPIEIDDFRLTNGLRVLLYHDPTSPIVDARLVYPTGTVDEDPEHPGVAETAALMLDHDFEREYPGPVYDKLVWALGLGTQLGNRVGRSSTVFVARGLAIFADWHVWRLSWLIDQGVYSGKELEARKRDLTEAGEGDKSPADQELYRRLFGKTHPYAAPPPTLAQRTAISARELALWKARHFATTGATLIVSGGFDRAVMRRTIDELFGSWSKTTPTAMRTPPPVRPDPGPGWIGVRDKSATQVRLQVAFAAGSDSHRDRAARLVLAAMVSDRLRIVREGLGASYGVSADYTGPAGAVLGVVTALDPVRAPKAATAIVSELASVRADATAFPGDFARARRHVLGNLLADSTDATTVATRLQRMVEDGGQLDQLRNLAEAVAKVTPAEVAAVAGLDLDPTRMVVSVGGRVEPVEATLAGLGAKDIDWFDE